MLKRIIKTVTVAVTIACLVVCIFPVQAFADPISATIVANAFAQAIAAYGAANGVAMTFDVSSTSSIGESVHELWKDFREGTQDADDYATLAAALFPDLYYKAATAVGIASDTYTVGFNISSEYAEEFDNFYNWLLSGPAEMVQVDNQYYQFQQSQIGPSSSPIPVYSVGEFSGQPLPWYDRALSLSDSQIYNISLPVITLSNTSYRIAIRSSNSVNITPSDALSYSFFVYDSETSKFKLYGYCFDYTPSFTLTYYDGSYHSTSLANSVTVTIDNVVYNLRTYATSFNSSVVSSINVPVYNSLPDGMSAILSWNESPVYSDSIGVKAYDNTGVAEFPDTTDPNYDALHRAREIPTDIPWDDTLYGDGTGTLTDAQTEAIASDVDLTLVEDGVIELVEEGVQPAPTPNEVVIPLLPVGLPSFNFSFSGIWHYVREWVSSLGAWFATLFSIWAALPYAMVVPVYATAVVVIVLGVYKRFFM